MIFYFSGCGNSRWIAEELAVATGDKPIFIPDVKDNGFNVEGETLGFVFPIYSWAAPQLVEDFVLKMTWTGTPEYVWFACTCGDNMGRAFERFQKTLSKVGLILDSGFYFQMPETYLCMAGFRLDSEEGARKKIEAARAKLPVVIAAVRARKKGVKDVIAGLFPFTKTYLIRPGFVKNVSDKKYHSTKECTGCGLCARVCPLHNIEMVDGKPQWTGHCTQCMACYHHCPTNAIQFGTTTLGKGQYYFKR
ncbi:MAG: EFR1 family ferrodoxin [Bacteroidales bacterium]|nr:EFR1 family ferrodoxin [Bacteroidales bacterium]MDD4669454.1 EFR1 family ferrodoxin [Bacteroidales bacterium]